MKALLALALLFGGAAYAKPPKPHHAHTPVVRKHHCHQGVDRLPCGVWWAR